MRPAACAAYTITSVGSCCGENIGVLDTTENGGAG